MLIESINGEPAANNPWSQLFIAHGFARTALGLQLRPEPRGVGPSSGIRDGVEDVDPDPSQSDVDRDDSGSD